jgi:multidrug efflux system membrane fusion protein
VRALGSLPGGASARAMIAKIPVRMGTSASDQTPYEGHLQLIDNQVDAKSGTIRVRATFDNKDGTLIPGQFARIRMGQAQATHALLVSERAVGTDQNKKFVWVIGPDNKAQYREITLGASADGMRVVTSGLKGGERIVVNGLQRVRPGVDVIPQLVEMNAKANAAKKEQG